MKDFDIKMSELRILMRHYGNDATLRQIFEHKKNDTPFVCKHCGGSGVVELKVPKPIHDYVGYYTASKPLGFTIRNVSCPMCKGEGYLKEDYIHV